MLSRLKQTISILTYRDMVDFSTMLAEKVGTDQETMADALLSLPGDTQDEQLEKTNNILSGCFSRKRQITIQPEHHPAGGVMYKIACPSVDGAVVFDSNIREGVSQLLDTLTVLQAFNDG